MMKKHIHPRRKPAKAAPTKGDRVVHEGMTLTYHGKRVWVSSKGKRFLGDVINGVFVPDKPFVPQR